MYLKIKSLTTSITAITVAAVVSLLAVGNAHAIERSCDAEVTVKVYWGRTGDAHGEGYFRKKLGEVTDSDIVGTGRSTAKRSQKSKARAKARDKIYFCFADQADDIDQTRSADLPYWSDVHTPDCEVGVEGWDKTLMKRAMDVIASSEDGPFDGSNYGFGPFSKYFFDFYIKLDIIGPDRCEGRDRSESIIKVLRP